MEGRETKPRFGIANFEKRRHPRFLLNLPVEYYRINSNFACSGSTFNASEGGLMVKLPERIDIGQYLRLKLFFSLGLGMDSIEALSQVVWVDDLEQEEGYRYGVRFVAISSEDMSRLKTFLKKVSN
ncbi:MAG: PilZ domain-containing protein [Deltaproteobacteria bacterium]|nr:PilZ domain-containing protein [Deltaproteobacteria bacterium]